MTFITLKGCTSYFACFRQLYKSSKVQVNAKNRNIWMAQLQVGNVLKSFPRGFAQLETDIHDLRFYC